MHSRFETKTSGCHLYSQAYRLAYRIKEEGLNGERKKKDIAKGEKSELLSEVYVTLMKIVLSQTTDLLREEILQ